MGGILSYLPPYSIVQPRSDIGPCAAILCPPLASTAMLSLFGLRTLSVDPAGLCPAEETGFPLASSRTVRSPSYHFLPLNLRSCRPTPYPVQTWSGGGGGPHVRTHLMHYLHFWEELMSEQDVAPGLALLAQAHHI